MPNAKDKVRAAVASKGRLGQVERALSTQLAGAFPGVSFGELVRSVRSFGDTPADKRNEVQEVLALFMDTNRQAATGLFEGVRVAEDADRLLAKRFESDFRHEAPEEAPLDEHQQARVDSDASRRDTLRELLDARETQQREADAQRMGLSPEHAKSWNGERTTVSGKLRLELERAHAKHSGTAPVLRLEGSLKPDAQPPPDPPKPPSLRESLEAAHQQHTGSEQ